MKKMPKWFVPALSLEELRLRERRFHAAFNAPVPIDGNATAYQKYLRSPHWRNMRKAVLILANFRCADCGGEARQVHHLTYARKGRELFSDLEPICDGCHGKRHPDKRGKGNL